MRTGLRCYWNWKEYDVQFSLLEARYYPSGYIYPGFHYLEIIIFNFGLSLEWEGEDERA